MSRHVKKPRKPWTKNHVNKIADVFNKVYGIDKDLEQAFVQGYLAAKRRFPDTRYQICTKCHKLLHRDDFGKGRLECRYCRI